MASHLRSKHHARRRRAIRFPLIATLATMVSAVLAAGIGVVHASTDPAPADGYEVTEHVTFTNPNEGEEGQQRLKNDLIGLIDNADEGSTIQLAVYRFKDADIAERLVAAERDRGVTVRVLVPDRSTDKIHKDVLPALEDNLGTDKSADSYLAFCSDTTEEGDHPCVNTRYKMHNKFATFSSVAGKKDVVFESSGNLNSQIFWNNAVVTVERSAIFQEFSSYFGDLVAAEHDNDGYGNDRDVSDGPYRSYLFPRNERHFYNDVLKNVSCSGGTRVDVAALIFTDRDVLGTLRALGNDGCDVRVAYMDYWVSDWARSQFEAAAAEGSIESWYVPDTDYANARSIHSKYLTIDGDYYDTADRKLVWMGSLNFSEKALRYDESVLRVEADSYYDSYRANFEDIIAGPDDQIRKN